MDDVIGCHVMRLTGEPGAPCGDSAFFCIYAYHLALRKGLKGSSGLARQRHTYVFEVDVCGSYKNNLRLARKWQSAFLWTLRGHNFKIDPNTGDVVIPEALPAQRRFLCLINPKSGPGRSLEIFLHRVRTVLSEADVAHLLLITERFNHAREFVRNLELDQWSGIVIVSGDGLLHEVYNGLMERPDGDQAVKIPVGVIPGGSGNGLARSICHASGEPYLADPVLACTLSCVKGRVLPLDLCKIEMPEKEPIYSFLSFGWGIMSDIDIEISYLPAKGLGPALAPVVKKSSVPNGEVQSQLRPETETTCDERAKHSLGSVSVPRPPSPSHPSNFTFGSEIHQKLAGRESNGNLREQASASRLLRSQSLLGNINQGRKEEKSPLKRVNDDEIERCNNSAKLDHQHATVFERVHTRSNPYASPDQQLAKAKGKPNDKEGRRLEPDVNGNAPSANVTISVKENIYLEPRSEFPTLDEPVPASWKVEEGRFVIIYTSLVSHLGTKLFFAPEAHLSGGVCWLMLIKGEASRRQIASYFINQEVGKHVDLPWVRLFPVKAFRLESFDESIMTIDGEMVRANIVQSRVLPGKARIFSL
ncbi:sphingosine kinase 1-like [Tropilaelaps mercedesae]|uniref:sphingosine kinase n=1 Tax=Tropilaelaps mercedesae TaxID=418985 RepID=A0A1V9XQC0_9ACAR|nr:sphingosine kinase 1-like [Tropilaelaps mercedesae]